MLNLPELMQAQGDNGIATTKRVLASYVRKYVPCYRGVGTFEEIPIVTKTQLVANSAAHISDEIPNLKSDLLRTLENSSLRTGRSDDVHYACGIVIEQTSGTSGIALLVPKTKSERIRSSFERYRRGYDPEFRQSLFYPLVHPGKNTVRPFSPGLLTKENIDNLYHYLVERKIRWIHINPRLLEAHLDLVDPEIMLGSPLRIVESAGFPLSSNLRAEVERRWKVKVIDQYGCREVWVMGVRDDSGPFTVLEDNVIVELCDQNGEVIRVPEQPGRIIVSSVYQRLMPFVRYDTGDIGMWEDRTLSKLKLSPSRAISFFQVGECRVDGVSLFKEILYCAYRTLQIHSIRYIQIIHVGDLRFRVISHGLDEHLALSEQIERRFIELYPTNNRAIFESVVMDTDALEKVSDNKPLLFINEALSPIRQYV
jgi:phenylacetate-CoA ligase